MKIEPIVRIGTAERAQPFGIGRDQRGKGGLARAGRRGGVGKGLDPHEIAPAPQPNRKAKKKRRPHGCGEPKWAEGKACLGAEKGRRHHRLPRRRPIGEHADDTAGRQNLAQRKRKGNAITPRRWQGQNLRRGLG